MAELKGTQTEKNLLAAFAGESQAYLKYEFFAEKAKKDGYVQIGKLFTETANNERAHAEMWFQLLKGSQIPATVENLKEAAVGENYEWTSMYAEFARQAKEEGFSQISAMFEGVAAIEKMHENRYRKLISNIDGECVFSKSGDVIWECANCGHVVIGKKAPEICPVCHHPQDYFQVKAENY